MLKIKRAKERKKERKKLEVFLPCTSYQDADQSQVFLNTEV